MQALLAYKHKRREKLTDVKLISLLGVRHDYLTLLRKGEKTGEEINYGRIINAFNHCLLMEHEIMRPLDASSLAYKTCEENITLLRRGLNSMEQDAIILLNRTHGMDKNPLWEY